MKRPFREDKTNDVHRTGDIKRDLSEKQLAGIGAAALAFNALEERVDLLLSVATRMPSYLFQEVSTRINGLEGKVSIIQAAIKEATTTADTGLATEDIKRLGNAVGDFMELKKIRDAIMHARIVNASIGIGVGGRQRGSKAVEILLSVDALDKYYLHILLLDQVLSSGSALLNAVITHWERGKSDPYKSQFEQAIQGHQVLFQSSLHRRQSLPPLSKFPDEDELREAANRWRAALREEITADFLKAQRSGREVYFVPENLAKAAMPPNKDRRTVKSRREDGS
jgi:hypothetical protein